MKKQLTHFFPVTKRSPCSCCGKMERPEKPRENVLGGRKMLYLTTMDHQRCDRCHVWGEMWPSKQTGVWKELGGGRNQRQREAGVTES